MNLDGKSGWRLPNVRELHGITDPQENAPAIDATAFPGTPAGYVTGEFWSSTSVTSNTGWAWYLYFDNGGVFEKDFSLVRKVRCVRGG